MSIDDTKLYPFSHYYFILVDDAQNFINCKDVVAFIKRKGKAICLAFSPVLAEKRGTSTANCPIQATKKYYFTQFNEEEIKMCGGVNLECIKNNILLPKFISMQEPIHNTKECDHLYSMFHKFLNASAELADNRETLTVNLINAATCVPGKLSLGERTAALHSGLFYERGNAYYRTSRFYEAHWYD